MNYTISQYPRVLQTVQMVLSAWTSVMRYDKGLQ